MKKTGTADREDMLAAIGAGVLTLADLVEAAAASPGSALDHITLRRALLAQPGVGVASADAVVAHVREVLGGEITARRLTVGWVLDARSEGRRLDALVDALTPRDVSPWIGFPFAPAP